MAFSRQRTGSAAAGTNAASQWIWDRPARRARAWSWRYTAVGYVIHHASSIFWSLAHEAWRQRQPRPALARAAGVATLAYVVDYHVVPARLSPGFERRIGKRGMLVTYAGFALGLYLVERLHGRQRT